MNVKECYATLSLHLEDHGWPQEANSQKFMKLQIYNARLNLGILRLRLRPP